MANLTWNFTSRGAEYRAPRLRVYFSAVVTASDEDEETPADWVGERAGEYWQPLRLDWAINGRPTTLALRRVLGVGAGKDSRCRPESEFCVPGDRVRLVEASRGGTRDAVEQEWFRGYVGQDGLLVEADAGGETYQVIAYGPEILLQGKVVSGQWHATPTVDAQIISGSFATDSLARSNTFRSHLPVIFNERGEPNASPATVGDTAATWRLDSRGEAETPGARVFEATGRAVTDGAGAYEAELWPAGPAVQSLLEMIDDYEVISPASVAMLPAELSEAAIGEVNVEGANLLDALAAVLVPIGYGFCLEPWADRDGRHLLRVFELQGRIDGSRLRKAVERMRPPWFRFGRGPGACECVWFFGRACRAGFRPVQAGLVGHRFPVTVVPPEHGDGGPRFLFDAELQNEPETGPRPAD